jgi:hypothetical protein
MATEIGADLKETLQEIGMQIEVLHSGQASIYEYANIIPNRQVTKPFVLEFFREATLSYDTAVMAGDIVKVPDSDEVFLVVNKTPQGFEGETFKFNSFFYKCNVSGQLRRYTEPDWDGDYHKDPTFRVVRNECYALQTEGLFRHGIEEDISDFARIGIEDHTVYVPTSYGVLLEDRWEATSGEFQIVQSIKKRQFINVSVLILKEDTR